MKLTISVLTVVICGFGAGMVGAADPMSDKEAKPTLGERITKDTVEWYGAISRNCMNSSDVDATRFDIMLRQSV